MFSKCQFLVRDAVLIFWGIPQGFPANSEYSQELWLNDVDHCGLCGHLPHFLLSKFCHKTLNCLSIRYIVPAKISPALPLCQKNWFYGKVHLYDFYPLLRSIASNWIYISVKRSTVYTTWKIWKKNSKTQLWDEKQNRVLFLDHPVFKVERNYIM